MIFTGSRWNRIH